MKKITFRNSQGLNLVGEFCCEDNSTRSCAIISHGFAANKDRPRLVKLGESLIKLGIAVLRFDFGGCGESENREITLNGQIDDLKSAIDLVADKHFTKIALIGESFGGLTSIHACGGLVKTMILLAPVIGSLSENEIELNELGRKFMKEEIIIFKKGGRDFTIPKQYLYDRTKINQKEILKNIKVPVLILHGDQDKTIPLMLSMKAMKYLSEDSQLKKIHGGHHTLDENIDEVSSNALEWLKEKLIK